MPFPEQRSRRMRRTESLRGLVRETRVEPSDLIYPLFCVSGHGIRDEVASMPGIAAQALGNRALNTPPLQGLGGLDARWCPVAALGRMSRRCGWCARRGSP